MCIFVYINTLNSYSYLSFSHGVLFLSIAVSTTDCQVSRLVAFFHADESREASIQLQLSISFFSAL